MILYVHILCLLLLIWKKDISTWPRTQKAVQWGSCKKTQNLGIHTNDGVFHVGCHRILCSLIFLRDITSLWRLVFPHDPMGPAVKGWDPTTCTWYPTAQGFLCLPCLNTLMPESRDSLVSNEAMDDHFTIICHSNVDFAPTTKKTWSTCIWCINLHVLRFNVWVKSQTSHQLHCPNIPLGSHGQFDGWKKPVVLPQDHGGCGKNAPTLSTTILREIYVDPRNSRFNNKDNVDCWNMWNFQIWDVFERCFGHKEEHTACTHRHTHIRP